MSGSARTYARDRHAEMELAEVQVYEAEFTHELSIPAGHCPNCSLEYQLARMLAGRREESDHCAICEIEEGRP